MRYIKYMGLRVHWPEGHTFWSLHVSDTSKKMSDLLYIFPKGFFFPLPAEERDLIKLAFFKNLNLI